MTASFFALKAASDDILEPFGFDQSDIPVQDLCQEFWDSMASLVECVGWSPCSEEIKVPWGPNEGHSYRCPGKASNGPPGEDGLVRLITEAMGSKLGMSEENVRGSCRRLGGRVTHMGGEDLVHAQKSEPDFTSGIAHAQVVGRQSYFSSDSGARPDTE